ncbi:hypothetical protein AAG906_001127 [Vitis piasezkii]
MDLLLILDGPRICNLRKDMWREIPHNAPLIRLLLSDWVADDFFAHATPPPPLRLPPDALRLPCRFSGFLFCSYVVNAFDIGSCFLVLLPSCWDDGSDPSSVYWLRYLLYKFGSQSATLNGRWKFLHFTQIPPVFLHPNVVRVLMGCSVLDMLFQLELSLLELVIDLPCSCKGWEKGHILVYGPWSGSSEGPDKVFSSQRSLEIPSMIRFCHFLCVLRLFLSCCKFTNDLSVCVIHARRGRDAL